MKPSSKTENKSPIRMGVIGAGLVGAKHAAIAARLPGCRLVGIADPDSATQHLAEDLTVVCYDDYQEMISDVDNLRYICGEIQNVYAQVSSAVRGFEVEDTACVTLRFNNGALGTVVSSDCVPSRWSYEAATGENPAYFNTHEDCYLFFGTEGPLAFPTMKRIHYASPSKIGWKYPIQTEEIPAQEQDPLIRQIEHFCAVICGEETPRTSGEDALRPLAVIRAVLNSGASGKALAPNFGKDIRKEDLI